MDYAHPVSYLQELMAKQRKDLPLYNFETTATSSAQNKFICTLQVDGLEATGTGANKQTAKYEAAKQAVERICNSSRARGKSQHMPPNPADDLSAKFNYNPVGKLNEITSQRRILYPTYAERGMDERNQFIISCQIADKVTTGRAPTKKNAKQAAAHHMLKLINDGMSNLADLQKEPESFPDDNDVIEKFKSLSVKNEVKHEQDGINIERPYTNPVHTVKSEEVDFGTEWLKNLKQLDNSSCTQVTSRMNKLNKEKSRRIRNATDELINTAPFQGEVGFLPMDLNQLASTSTKKYKNFKRQ